MGISGFFLRYRGSDDDSSLFFTFFVHGGAVAFRMPRVVRSLRLFKINSRYDAFNVITEVIRDKINSLVSSIFMVLVLMLEKGGGPPKRAFSS